ncbi:MAG TPA: M13 family metallopeptidase, partial [Bryobacteraceae bacterium]|nr:M13 family metallopeptidase [Bryobacteraceae bacterium]
MCFKGLILACAAGCILFAQSAPRSIRSFDVEAMDTSVDPCTDFFQYSCGMWMKQNPIPPDQARWGRFDELQERNRHTLRDILEKAAVSNAGRTAVEQKIGDYYASCIDEKTIEQQGVKPLAEELKRIDSLSAKSQLPETAARLHKAGVRALFRFTSAPDLKNSAMMIADVDQSGLGLPDRDYYFKDDERSVELRKKYLEHVAKMFQLLGQSQETAAASARTVMKMETALAKASLDRVARREPSNIYHKMSSKELQALAPSFGWNRYFEGTGTPAFDSLNVSVPEFFKQVSSLAESTDLNDWKTYFRWHLVRAMAPVLSSAFVNENFDFYGRTLTGAKALRPRWNRCVTYTDADLGEAVGQKYVERTFGAEGKARTLRMVRQLEKALEDDIRSLDWMTPETKKRALEKLHAITNKIGYPDRWRDYSRLKIVRGDAFGNSLRANEFNFEWSIRKIGKPVDPQEWHMSPPTVNAYYDPTMNNINFPAGILQPPFYDNKIDDAVNFGGIGAVIGHELTHGFDDQGRKFDAKGNLNDWWTEQDAQAFEKRAACFVDQYAQYPATPEVKLNGKLTLGENTADNGGLRIAYMALMDALEGRAGQKIDGFTPAQRFFISWGQVWCQNVTPEAARMRALVDPHSPGQWRVNGVVSN